MPHQNLRTLYHGYSKPTPHQGHTITPGHFQISRTKIPKAVLAACRGELDLTKPGNMDYLAGCSEIAALIKEEQLLNSQKLVSEPLKQLISFIIEAIECNVQKKPDFEAPDTSVFKNLEWFPTRPIIRKRVLYEIYRTHYTQSEKQYQHELSMQNQTDSPTKYKGQITRARSMELAKEERKKSLLKVKLPAKMITKQPEVFFLECLFLAVFIIGY